MHGTFDSPNIQIDPAILYFGAPVVLIGTTNEDASFNLAPMSSAWWGGLALHARARAQFARRPRT